MKKLAECFGTKIAKKTVDNILRKLESLQDFEEMGIIMSIPSNYMVSTSDGKIYSEKLEFYGVEKEDFIE